MEITIDLAKLSAAEVDFMEDTLNDQLASRLGANIVEFGDLVKQFKWEADVRAAEAEGVNPPAFPAGVVKVPSVKVMRVIELVQLRRSNPNAKWEDTGQDPLFTGITEPPTGPVNGDVPVESDLWPTPQPTEPFVLPA